MHNFYIKPIQFCTELYIHTYVHIYVHTHLQEPFLDFITTSWWLCINVILCILPGIQQHPPTSGWFQHSDSQFPKFYISLEKTLYHQTIKKHTTYLYTNNCSLGNNPACWYSLRVTYFEISQWKNFYSSCVPCSFNLMQHFKQDVKRLDEICY